MANSNSIREVTITLEKTGKTVFKWALSYTITYNIAKMKARLFFKAYYQKAKEEIVVLRLIFGGQVVKFNNKTIRWLGV